MSDSAGRSPNMRELLAEAADERERAVAARPRKHRVEGEKPWDMDPASGWLLTAA